MGLVLLFLLRDSSFAYDWPLPSANETTQQRITSTFGEYRNTQRVNCLGACPHFHDGVYVRICVRFPLGLHPTLHLDAILRCNQAL